MAHTIKVIAGGLVLFALCPLIARFIGSPGSVDAIDAGAKVFIPG